MTTPPAAPPYADTAELLKALGRIGNVLIEWAQTARQAVSSGPGEPDGSPGELMRARVDQLAARIDQEWTSLDQRGSATVQAGRFIPWLHLCALFQLNRHEQTLVLLALLPELDARYGPILSALADQPPAGGDVPLTAGLRLLGGSGGRAALRQALSQDGALLTWQVLELAPGADVLAGRGAYRLAPMLGPYLLGQAIPRPRWDEPLPDIPLDRPLPQMLLEPAVAARAQALVRQWQTDDGAVGGYLLQVQTVDQPAALALCAALFDALGLGCVHLDARAIRRNHTSPAPRLRLLCRDALLSNRVPVLTDAQWLCVEGDDDLLTTTINALLSSHRHLAVINGPAWRLADLAHQYAGHRVVPLSLTLPHPDAARRGDLWRLHAGREGIALPDELAARLVGAYQFTETQIATALKDAAARRLLDSGDEALLVAACRAQTEREQLALASEVRTGHRLSDVILPAATGESLQEVLLHTRHRDHVMEDWGFAAKTHEGRNLCVLFHGSSGTGKTMAASALANELGLGLYKIDLASVLSKYIGETEQRLAQLFDQAEAMNIVLFFDEAESLFSRRTEAHDANDRHANLQTGYLLQRIETYPGIVILSTNLLKNLDPAFTRRFQFIIEYPFPGPAERLLLWRNAFPAETPRAGDLDFPLLADKAVLTGGHILAAAIAAALYASAEAVPVAMDHVLRGIRREYDKLGKVFFDRDFHWPEED